MSGTGFAYANLFGKKVPAPAARWAGLNHGPYDSTPHLRAEATRGLVFGGHQGFQVGFVSWGEVRENPMRE